MSIFKIIKKEEWNQLKGIKLSNYAINKIFVQRRLYMLVFFYVVLNEMLIATQKHQVGLVMRVFANVLLPVVAVLLMAGVIAFMERTLNKHVYEEKDNRLRMKYIISYMIFVLITFLMASNLNITSLLRFSWESFFANVSYDFILLSVVGYLIGRVDFDRLVKSYPNL